ncbi:hypothetical protein BWQ96_06396 [Gracilariopsis chorda]|uniref:Uncharacterized protein n=1 Tax=Gracilariopsis chorda TaxID=448386 RepID=A0A2V3IRV0_9FLOR|nr:hypothetical protein BWQ96_06396 [Gracilariopsis chorda]|eukprot:PXF43850.1 hypothetical protein BWQ96_06396 [Gracilariopsis chorda]
MFGMELSRMMIRQTRNPSPAWMATYNCSRKGLGHYSKWDLHGFYEDKFNDPLNLNLSENAVSLLTALSCSFSLILFTDIVFRIAVRAKTNQVSKQVVFRRHLLNSFSNPINLLSVLVNKLQSKQSASTSTEGTQNLEWKALTPSSKRNFTLLLLLGLLTVFVEFLFIFLATNQNKMYAFQLDEVPVFEFEDRGCERIASPVIDSCIQESWTEKAGFNTHGYLQICSSQTVSAAVEDEKLSKSNGIVSFVILDTDGVDVIVRYREINAVERTTIGVILESGSVYQGLQNVSSKSLLFALSNRFRRSNATILDTFAQDNMDSGAGILENPPTEQNAKPDAASILVSLENVDLRETHLSHILHPNSSEGDLNLAMVIYLHDVARSIMFPTGTGRGVRLRGREILYLDEVETPLAHYNRPWIGVLPSLIICGVLLLIWIFVAVMRIENEVDSRLAWKEFFKSTMSVEDFGKGSDEWQEMCWRCDGSGNRSFGFSPRM